MADNVNGKKIKQLILTNEIYDLDDFILETDAPETKRVKWSTIVSVLKNLFDIETIQEIITDLGNMYVQDNTLFLDSSIISINNNTLIIRPRNEV